MTALEEHRADQHRVLVWGILTAIVLRGVMIIGGLELLERFSWLSYVLGAVLLDRGWSTRDVEKVLGLNALRALREAEAVARRLAAE